VRVDYDEIGSWGEVEYAEELVTNMAFADNVSGDDDSRIGFASEAEVVGNEDVVNASGVVDLHPEGHSEIGRTLAAVTDLKVGTITVGTGSQLMDSREKEFFTSGFPTLLPYGEGGHKDDKRKEHLSFAKWGELLMRHHSRRFQRSSRFVLLCYDVGRRQNNSLQATLETQRRDWARTEQMLNDVTVESLEEAARQAASYEPIRDPAVLRLLKSVSRVEGKRGGDAGKAKLLAELKSVFVMHGCPHIFLTINPADRHSPLALRYAGEDIDIGNFDTVQYNAEKRMKLMLDNPMAVVEYFRQSTKIILDEVLLSGLFGPVQHYYGTIEYQGRGTPHLHLLVREVNGIG
jgi:hypothetical protein